MGDFSINISGNLVNRLVEDEKLKKKPKRPKPKISREPKQPQTKLNQKQILDDSKTQKGSPAGGWPLQPPLFLPGTPTAHSAELDAIRSVLKESERVLEKLEKKEENMVQQVTERAKTLRDQEFKLPYQKPLPCLAEKDACESCYKEYAKDPLKCLTVLRHYADCSRRARQQVS
ncbi:Copper ion binding protein [Melia azedarach]|uniref:Copper ion binding protein n=1 Tax=Melia azedarach TaxID=155640 RepID=A0ACC1XPM2_MELAZ|nr:Copper ion binding protein [Melia azedarach]